MRVYKIMRKPKGTHLISCGNIIPHEWDYFTAEVIERTDNSVTVKFRRAELKVD